MVVHGPVMKTITQFPRKIVEHPDVGIVMPDGCRLSARIWLPEDAEDDPVPAILEHLPYRKRDGTTQRDSLTHPYLAGHGYASIRVDMRGNGDSEGVMEDEYTEQELQDACDVIAWAAAQPWCTGKVGMMGISWGGFNALQVAARQPPALKAIVTLCSTDDRYADDIHYKGGLPAQREHRLGRHHAVLFVAPAGSGDRRRQPLARPVVRPPGARAVPAGALAEAPAPRPPTGSTARSARISPRIKAATLAVGGWARRLSATPSRGCSQGSRPPRSRASSVPGSTNIRISPFPSRLSAFSRRRCAGGTAG